jgi:hypothetical protein
LSAERLGANAPHTLVVRASGYVPGCCPRVPTQSCDGIGGSGADELCPALNRGVAGALQRTRSSGARGSAQAAAAGTSRKVADWMPGQLGLEKLAPQRGWEALRAIDWSIQSPRPHNPNSASAEETELADRLPKKPTSIRQADRALATDEHRIGLKPIQRRVWAALGERPIALGHHRYKWFYVTAFVAPMSGETVWYLSNGIGFRVNYSFCLSDDAARVQDLPSEWTYATRSQICPSLRIRHDGIAVPGTPSRITRKVWAAFAASDHVGMVRSAGGGFMPIRREPWPSPFSP